MSFTHNIQCAVRSSLVLVQPPLSIIPVGCRYDIPVSYNTLPSSFAGLIGHPCSHYDLCSDAINTRSCVSSRLELPLPSDTWNDCHRDTSIEGGQSHLILDASRGRSQLMLDASSKLLACHQLGLTLGSTALLAESHVYRPPVCNPSGTVKRYSVPTGVWCDI